MPGIGQGRKVLINFPAGLIARDVALALPKTICVVEILETVKPEPDILQALARLKEAGYTLALDDYVGEPGYEPLIELADIVKVELLGMAPPEIIKLSQRLKKHGKRLLAEKVEDAQVFSLCKSLGYDYFQGYFFSKPEIVPGRKLSSAQLAKMQLMQELASPDYEVKRLAKIIATDLSLSYRLLRFINSVAFSLSQKVTSIAQAVTILGHQSLRQWVMVVLLSDMNQDARSGELSHLSVQRGRFLEQLATAMPAPPHAGDSMFMLGLFSKLDALLGQPMEEVASALPLDQGLKQALVDPDSSEHIWIELVEAVELGRWDTVQSVLDRYKVPAEEAATAYTQAGQWAAQLLRHSAPAKEAP